MKLLLFFLAMYVIGLFAQNCSEIVPAMQASQTCPIRSPSGECCACVSEICEGCEDIPCDDTTEVPVTTAAPPVTTEAPPVVTVEIPVTTEPPVTTECTCPPAVTCATTTSTAKSGKSSKPIGCGVGDCDCEKGVVELRFKYLGAYNGVTISLGYDKDWIEDLCVFTNVQRGEQVVCNLRGGPGLVTTSKYEKFKTETPFTITGPNNYACAAQYHTSCSQDIVGVIQPECVDLVVSGWQDIGNLIDGGDCDDGIDNDCECFDQITITTTTSNPVLIPLKIGDYCYCDTTDGSTATTAPTTTAKSKGKKSKGNKGSKKSKGSKNGDGLGIGDCDCDGGQTELTMMYSGTETVDIDFFHKDGTKICTVTGVAAGAEAICNVLDYKSGGQSVYSKLGTNTFIDLASSATGSTVCQMSVHTSCSRDIIGSYGNDGHDCGTSMIVSGWKDANNEVSGGECDDGLDACNCDGTVFVPETVLSVVSPVDENIVQILTDICYCSTVTDTDAFSDIMDTIDAGNKKVSRGYGDCDCNDGVRLLRFVYLPRDITTAPTGDLKIILAFKDSFDDDEIFCIIDNVAIGTEYECKVEDAPYGADYHSLNKETYIKLVDATTDELVPGGQVGYWHTSCSSDIIGWAAQDEPNVIATGWADNSHPDGEDCDDGWEKCECATWCENLSTAEGTTSPCATTDGCYVDESTGACESLAYQFYTGSGAKEVSLIAVIALMVVAVLY